MNAAATLAAGARRFGCTLRLLGPEIDASGASAERGQACAQCGDCTRDLGPMGYAAAGVEIVAQAGGLVLRWACPQCGNGTLESTTLLRSSSDAAAILADPLCFVCRKMAQHLKP